MQSRIAHHRTEKEGGLYRSRRLGLAGPWGVSGKVPPFSAEDRLRELVNRLNTIPGISLSDRPVYPCFALEEVVLQRGIPAFLEVLAWAMDEIEGVPAR